MHAGADWLVMQPRTLVDELGGGHPVQLAINDFLEVSLQRIETSVPPDEQPEVLWEKED